MLNRCTVEAFEVRFPLRPLREIALVVDKKPFSYRADDVIMAATVYKDITL